MSFDRKSLDTPTGSAPRGGEMLTLLSMALVVAAVVVGLHRHVGIPIALSSLAGLCLFAGLVAVQAWRRSEAERRALVRELSELEGEVVRARTLGPVAPRAARPVGERQHTGHPAPPIVPQPAPFGLNEDTGIQMKANIEDARLGVDGQDAPRFEAYHGVPVAAPGQSLGDYWSVPAATTSSLTSQSTIAPPPLSAADELPADHASAVREDDVEMLQRRIKEMLHQVSAAELARGPQMAPIIAAAPQLQPSLPKEPDDLDASLDALHAAAQALRQRSAVSSNPVPPPLSQHGISGDAEPAGKLDEATDPQLLAIREAIAADRIDVFLEPILGLGDQTTQHYEVSIKLRGAGYQDLGSGEGDVLPGRGLLPLFDSARFARSAVVAERLASRGKSGSVFSHASAESLIAPDFTRKMQLDFVARPGTARKLILTFSQADIRSFRAAEQRAVGALSALGFRFAISGLTDLDMNFGAMAKAGFNFVKIDESLLVEGLAHPGGHVPASDVCRFLAEHGFGLIVNGIDNEDKLARVFGFGVLLGQGTLFGGPRPVKADIAAKSGQAAA